jgi:hypothetical protein
MPKSLISTTICLLACMVLAGCHGDIRAVWTESSGRVPSSAPAVEGFKIRPLEALIIAEKEFGMRKTVQHVYADSRYYYIVDGFSGSQASKAEKSGRRVDGRTGKCQRVQLP